MCLTGGGHCVLLHRLEQRGLRLRRRAIDLVRQHDVGEDRSLRVLEKAPAGRVILLQQLGARDVARHQIGRELHARKREVEGLRHGLHEQRLREAGDADEENVSASQQGRDEIVDDFALADDAAADLFDQLGMRAGELVQQLDVAGVIDRFLSRRHSLASRT